MRIMTVYEAKESVVLAGKKLVEKGLIARTWGNVSCRTSSSHFVITPSGRDYLSLAPDEIVEVAISDCSYTGNIKPSSEKGIHAEVYKLYPDINFVIHTHQDNASVISTLGLDSISIDGDYPLLGDRVQCASYGLPGTKKLRKRVLEALKKTHGKAVIMKNHGVLCFGKDIDEAFKAATDLENACDIFIKRHFMKIIGQTEFDANQMNCFALSRLAGNKCPAIEKLSQYYPESERVENGFRLYTYTDKTIDISFNKPSDALSEEAAIYSGIFKENNNVNYIIHNVLPGTIAVSCAGIRLRPLLDDFAQIAGSSVNTVDKDVHKINSALKNASAVLVSKNGALCCGNTKEDAAAVSMIMEKQCRALLAAALFGEIKPINRLECSLMRFIYLKKYSKQAGNK